jgi:hypothetical protein
MKQHDTRPAVRAQLANYALLTGASVKFIMKLSGNTQPKVNALAVFEDPALGNVRYDWTAADTDLAGTFDAEWQVTYSDGGVETFPGDETYNTVIISPDLDGA